jgi:hypothetical protein
MGKWKCVGAANLTWRYLGKPKNFLSTSAFSLYYNIIDYRCIDVLHCHRIILHLQTIFFVFFCFLIMQNTILLKQLKMGVHLS